MCLVLLAINQHPAFPLIILSNRDEFYDRASFGAGFWDINTNIYAGIDLQGGGTWFGVTRNSHFALVTNHRSQATYQASLQS